MKTIHSLKEMQEYTALQRAEGKTVGLVPTMGALHEGHLSLIHAARKENDRVVVSIFVNPTQFGVNEDFDQYPRDLETDSKLAEKAGADIIFNPEAKDMYPTDISTSIKMGSIAEGLCGRYRPGHFDGVAIVVNKLFNLVNPHRAYFGQKDAQQVQVIRQMVQDLNMEVEIVSCPIIRESDGLAMSSRNIYLSEDERDSARLLNQALEEGRTFIEKGHRDPEELRQLIQKLLQSDPRLQVQYIEIVHPSTLQPLQFLQKPVMIALAVHIGKTRLIDNIIIEE
ncbi:MAG: pantoate--beta-alanine ligase [Tindallia sp. MSAO_Bac2]|nr:MAG: pantoate--beta-alanine ligase [Tindallia sp. MSAO_Bac2]